MHAGLANRQLSRSRQLGGLVPERLFWVFYLPVKFKFLFTSELSQVMLSKINMVTFKTVVLLYEACYWAQQAFYNRKLCMNINLWDLDQVNLSNQIKFGKYQAMISLLGNEKLKLSILSIYGKVCFAAKLLLNLDSCLGATLPFHSHTHFLH